MAKKVNYEDEIVFSVSDVARMFHKRTKAINDLISMGWLKAAKWGDKKINRWAIEEFWQQYGDKDIDAAVEEWKQNQLKGDAGVVIAI